MMKKKTKINIKDNNRNRLPKIKQRAATINNSLDSKTSVLLNGITVITEEVPTVESFSLGFFVKAGSRNDPPGLEGMAHFLEHASFRNTRRRTSRQIATQFESVGAYSNAYTTKEYTCYYVRALSKHFKKTLNILSDIITEPLLKDKDLNLERQIIKEEIKGYDDDPEEYILEAADKIIFGKHPLSHPVTGFESTVDHINKKLIEEFHSRNYSPGNIVVVSAGNLTHERLVQQIEKFFPRSLVSNYSVNENSNIPKFYHGKSKTLRKPAGQAHLVFALPLPDLNIHEKNAVSLMNIILGDGMSSRLNQSLREKRGLTYSVYSSVNFFKDCGALYIYTSAPDDFNLHKAADLIKAEMNKLREKGIFKSELIRAKEQLISGRIMDNESMIFRMENLARNYLETGKAISLSNQITEIDLLTLDDIRAAIVQYLKPEMFSTLKIMPS